MRLAISNIAWDVNEDSSVAALLSCYEIDAIDIAPLKYFPRPREASDDDVRDVRTWWTARGIEITGMQSLLFGTNDLNMFGPHDVRNAMLDHLGAICRIGGMLGATRLVFGSPRNRDRGSLEDAQANDIAVDFFRKLGDRAAAEGVVICLEPNPPRYGANYMTTSAETATVVQDVDHPAIRMQLDAGTIAINAEETQSVVAGCASLIGHVHASEPGLLPVGDGASRHDLLAQALASHLPDAIVCIEMAATTDEPHLESIERALAVAIEAYRGGVRG